MHGHVNLKNAKKTYKTPSWLISLVRPIYSQFLRSSKSHNDDGNEGEDDGIGCETHWVFTQKRINAIFIVFIFTVSL